MVVGLACTQAPATGGVIVGVAVPSVTGDEKVTAMSALEDALVSPEEGLVETTESGLVSGLHRGLCGAAGSRVLRTVGRLADAVGDRRGGDDQHDRPCDQEPRAAASRRFPVGLENLHLVTLPPAADAHPAAGDPPALHSTPVRGSIGVTGRKR